MKKSIWILLSLFLAVTFVACEEEQIEEKPYMSQKGKNLLAGWNGMGKVQPNAAGWVSTYKGTDFPWGDPDGTAGCRYRTPGKTLPTDFVYDDGSKFNSIELMLRFDNNKYEGAVLHYKTTEKLYPEAVYKFSYDYHVGNGGEKNLTAGFASSTEIEESEGKSQDGRGGNIVVHTMKNVVYEEIETTLQDAKTWKKASFTFSVEEEIEHYLFFKGDREWFGVANLNLELVE